MSLNETIMFLRSDSLTFHRVSLDHNQIHVFNNQLFLIIYLPRRKDTHLPLLSAQEKGYSSASTGPKKKQVPIMAGTCACPISSASSFSKRPLQPPLCRRIHAALSRRIPASLCCVPIRASSPPTPEMNYRGPEPRRNLVPDWVANNDSFVRSLPIAVGSLSMLAVLLNRTFSGIAPVADASSSQSRADILALGLAATNIFAGLVWLSIRPRFISPEAPRGVQCKRVFPNLPNVVVDELLWTWDSLSKVTCCNSLVIVYGNDCLLQIGVAAESSTSTGEAVPVDAIALTQGSLYQNVFRTGKQNYLANLSLYPARSELPFLPSNTQAVILQPVGEKGIVVVAGDTVRGFNDLDQAWMTSIADKLDATLSRF